MDWRLIIEDGVTASAGLAADETLAGRVGRGESPPTLRLYTYRPHCALVGRFQIVANEIRLDACKRNGIEVNRRPTGGGAILMGPDQLGVALTLPYRGDRTGVRVRDRMARFSRGLEQALQDLGVTSAFRGKNDIEVRGRKVAGLGLCRDTAGGLLFHASLLVDLDVRLMAEVLRTPFEMVTEKEIDAVSRRITTVRRETGSEIPLAEVRSRVADGFARVFGIRLAPGTRDAAEQAAVDTLEQERYLTAPWVFQRTDVPDRVGAAIVKTPGGRIEVHVTLAGAMLKAAYVRGDFFAPDSLIADLEGSLRWHASDPGSVAATVADVFCRRGPALASVDHADVARAVAAAAEQAREQRGAEEPYGCFVTPGAE